MMCSDTQIGSVACQGVPSRVHGALGICRAWTKSDNYQKNRRAVFGSIYSLQCTRQFGHRIECRRKLLILYSASIFWVRGFFHALVVGRICDGVRLGEDGSAGVEIGSARDGQTGNVPSPHARSRTARLVSLGKRVVRCICSQKGGDEDDSLKWNKRMQTNRNNIRKYESGARMEAGSRLRERRRGHLRLNG